MSDLIWLNRERAITRDSQVIPEPALRIEFAVIPSWNHLLASLNYPLAAQGMIKKWRKKGREQAIWHARRQGWQIKEGIEYGVSDKGKHTATKTETIDPIIFTEDCTLVLRIWRPNWRHYDVFSPFAKPVIDGFVDAGVLVDDNCERIREFHTIFMGVDPTLKLSPEAQEARRIKKQTKKGHDPEPARYWFDFYA